MDYVKLRSEVQHDFDVIQARKERILDLQIAGAITIEEFKMCNDICNEQLVSLESIEQEEVG